MTVQEILQAIETLAPYALAEHWDNCGLLVGNRNAQVSRVLCALDVTDVVLQEAVAEHAQLIVAHHPMIFTSVSSITKDTTTGRQIYTAIENGLSVICMHTNLDCAQGGVNDALANALHLKNVISMGAGESGALGRVGDIQGQAMTASAFAQWVKEQLQAHGVRYVDGGKPIARVAVGGGSCGKLMDFAIAQGADAFVTADCSYDVMQKAQSLGLTLIDAGHFATENPVVKQLVNYLTKTFPNLSVSASQYHQDIIAFI